MAAAKKINSSKNGDVDFSEGAELLLEIQTRRVKAGKDDPWVWNAECTVLPATEANNSLEGQALLKLLLDTLNS